MEAPVIRLVNSIFSQAIREGASDIHISPQQNNISLRFRIDGRLYEVPSPPKSWGFPSRQGSRSSPAWTSRSQECPRMDVLR